MKLLSKRLVTILSLTFFEKMGAKLEMNASKFNIVLFISISFNIAFAAFYFLVGLERNKGVITEVPMFVESEVGSVNYLLPKGVALYQKKSMHEGYIQYVAYFNYKGRPLEGTKVDGVKPTWIYELDEVRLRN